MIKLTPATFCRRCGHLKTGGVPVGGFLDEAKGAQTRGIGGFGLLRAPVDRPDLHMYVFCHHQKCPWLGSGGFRRVR
jgi:hypothetical protein